LDTNPKDDAVHPLFLPAGLLEELDSTPQADTRLLFTLLEIFSGKPQAWECDLFGGLV